MGYEGNDRGRWDRDRNEGRYEGRYGRGSYEGRVRGYYCDDDRQARNRYRDDEEDRGFVDRAGDEVRSWFGDEEAQRRRERDEREYNQRYGQGSGGAPGGYGQHYTGGGYGRGAAYGGYDLGSPTYYAPYTGGTYRENSRSYHDPRYHQWRDQQIAEFDRDYDDYRREHQSRFEQDFGSWRNTRQGQRSAVRQAREHQEVVGSDEAHVGTIDHVRGDRLILTKNDADAGGHHHSIPSAWIDKVDDKVVLNCTAEEAKRRWKDTEQRSAFGRDQGEGQGEGAHILDRSFAGTYNR